MSVEKKPRTVHVPMDSTTSNWPADIVHEIAMRLDTRRDIFHMRAVCSAWRSLIPIPPSGFPLKLPFPIVPNENLHPKCRGHFLLRESTIYCLEPLKKKKTTKSNTKYECKSWIVKVEETDSGKVRLKDPLSGLRIKCLRKVSNKVINLLDYRVREIGKAYTLEFVHEEEDGVFVGELNELELESTEIKKVVVGHDNKGELRVMALHSFDGMDVGGKLGVWKMGVDKWASVGDEYTDYYDIAYHNGKFYASKYTGETIAFDPSSLHFTKVGRDIDSHGCNQYLVGSLGDLLAIQLFRKDPEPDSEDSEDGEGEPYFEVYKLDEERREWNEQADLEDQVIFMGDDSLYTISATDFAAFKEKGNGIFFRDDYFVNGNFPARAARGAGFYNLEADTSWSLVSISDGYGDIFWPPPRWLQAKKNN